MKTSNLIPNTQKPQSDTYALYGHERFEPKNIFQTLQIFSHKSTFRLPSMAFCLLIALSAQHIQAQASFCAKLRSITEICFGGDGYIKLNRDRCKVGTPYRWSPTRPKARLPISQAADTACPILKLKASIAWQPDKYQPTTADHAQQQLRQIAQRFDPDCYRQIMVVIFTPHKRRLRNVAVPNQNFDFTVLMERRAGYIKDRLVDYGVPASAFGRGQWYDIRWHGKHPHSSPTSEVWFE